MNGVDKSMKVCLWVFLSMLISMGHLKSRSAASFEEKIPKHSKP